ncbi:MAG: ATP-dependent Clp protease ATP-binding subunit ClpA, partial [Desulfobulbaceae bacterium]|nr:ATP-dependent Clp protease ATP-binding subunit ClpA [Desulfobulbaceae bacterium]
EFRNRLDGIISFQPLAGGVIEKIVDKLIGELQDQLLDKKITITLSDAARLWLANQGYDPDCGARPLRRLIMKEIGDVLAEEILFGSLGKGGVCRVGIKNKKLTFAFIKK